MSCDNSLQSACRPNRAAKLVGCHTAMLSKKIHVVRSIPCFEAKENHSGQRSDIDVIGPPQSNVVEESLLQRRWNRRLKRGRELLNACVGIRGTTNCRVGEDQVGATLAGSV